MKKLALLLALIAALLMGCNADLEPEEDHEDSDSHEEFEKNEDSENEEETPEDPDQAEDPSQGEGPSQEEPQVPAGPQPHDPIQVDVPQLPTGYELTLIGTIDDPGLDLGFRSDNVIVLREYYDEFSENRDTLLSEMGEPMADEPYRSVEKIGDDLLAVKPYTDEVNSTALITYAGEMLIPHEAAYIDVLTTDYDADPYIKYLKVVYSTGLTDNIDEAFFFVSDEFFAMYPEEGDELHTGYAKIYDVENRRFLDLTITDASSLAVQACGDYLMVKENDVYNIYDENENLTASFPTSYSPDRGWNYVIGYEDGVERIYGCDGTPYYDSELSVSVLSDKFVLEVDYSGDERSYNVCDIYGNVFFRTGDVSIYEEHCGTFMICEDDVYSLLDQTGEVIVSMDGFMNYVNYGWWKCSVSGDEGYQHYLVQPDGLAIEADYVDQMIAYRLDGDTYNCFVYADGDFTLPINARYINVIEDGIINANTSDGYLLYDAFTGEQLLPDAYRAIAYAYGHVYAYADGVWSVYEITLNF